MAKRYGSVWLGAGLTGLIVLLAAAYGLTIFLERAPDSRSASEASSKPPSNARSQLVLTERVQRVDVPIEITAAGLVQASQSVSIRTRIDAAILEVHFAEGDEVAEGDLLFTLDARAIEAQIRQAEAILARDRVTLSNARRDAERYSSLARSDFVARQKLEDAMALVQSTENIVKAGEANIDALKVQRSYTRILAPIGGRTGRIALTKGNIARANEPAPLVTIHKIKPVYLAFAVPQRYLFDISSALENGITVTVDLKGKGKREGNVAFLDNAIDVSTGTLPVKAQFANLDGLLWPGMFASVTVRLGMEARALAVPSQTVQNGQKGPYLYVVTSDNHVERRPVIVLREASGGLTVLGEGVQEGETVVVEGQERLFPGAKVEMRSLPAARLGGAS